MRKRMKQCLVLFLSFAMAVTSFTGYAGMKEVQAEENQESDSGSETSLFDGVSIEAENRSFKRYGSDVPLSVNVTTEKDLDVSYQWYHTTEGYVYDESKDDYVFNSNSTEIDGATGASYTIPVSELEQYGEYIFTCGVTVSDGEISETVSVPFYFLLDGTLQCIMCDAPETMFEFKDIETQIYAVSKNGSDSITYQWSVDDEMVEGANSSSFTFPKERLTKNFHSISCLVSDGVSEQTCYAGFETHLVSIKYEYSYYIYIGEEKTLSVDVDSKIEADATYQWYQLNNNEDEWVAIEGATDSSLNVSADRSSDDERYYQCKVQVGEIEISTGTIRVYRLYRSQSIPFSMYSNSYDCYLDEGETKTLEIKASKENVTYQWYRFDEDLSEISDDSISELDMDGAIIEGATSSKYVVSEDMIPGNCTTFICKGTDSDSGEVRYEVIPVHAYTDFSVSIWGPSYVEVGKPVQYKAVVYGAEESDEVEYLWEVPSWCDVSLENTTSESIQFTPTHEGYIWLSCKAMTSTQSEKKSVDVFAIDTGAAVPLTVGSYQEVNMPEEGGASYLMYSFTPEKDGEYSFYLDGKGYANVDILDNKLNIIGSDEYNYDSQDGNIQELKENEMYYIKVARYEYFSGRITVKEEPKSSFKVLTNPVCEKSFLLNEVGTLSVDTDVKEGLTYQWSIRKNEQSSERWYPIAGEQGDTLQVRVTDGGRYATYMCEISDGTVTKEIIFGVSFGMLSVDDEGPIYDTARQNETKTMSVNASSINGNLSYEWVRFVRGDHYSEEVVKGATGSSLTLPIDFRNEKSVTYYCRVRNKDDILGVEFHFDLDTSEPEVEEESSVHACNLTLEADLKLNMYVSLPEEYDSAKMIYEVENADGTISTKEVAITSDMEFDYNDETWYKVPLALSAKQMGNNVTATVETVVDGEAKQSEAFDYSIKQYAINMLKSKTSKQETKNLVYATLEYGAAAQTYFNYKTDDLVNAILSDPEIISEEDQATYKAMMSENAMTYEQLSEYAAAFTSLENARSQIKGVALGLEDSIAIKVVVEKEKYVDGDMLAYRVKGTEEWKTVPMTSYDSTYMCAKIPGITAKKLDNLYEMYVVDAEGNQVSSQLTYGVFSYIYNKYNSETPGLASLVKMIQVYNSIAKKNL